MHLAKSQRVTHSDGLELGPSDMLAMLDSHRLAHSGPHEQMPIQTMLPAQSPVMQMPGPGAMAPQMAGAMSAQMAYYPPPPHCGLACPPQPVSMFMPPEAMAMMEAPDHQAVACYPGQMQAVLKQQPNGPIPGGMFKDAPSADAQPRPCAGGREHSGREGESQKSSKPPAYASALPRPPPPVAAPSPPPTRSAPPRAPLRARQANPLLISVRPCGGHTCLWRVGAHTLPRSRPPV